MLANPSNCTLGSGAGTSRVVEKSSQGSKSIKESPGRRALVQWPHLGLSCLLPSRCSRHPWASKIRAALGQPCRGAAIVAAHTMQNRHCLTCADVSSQNGMGSAGGGQSLCASPNSARPCATPLCDYWKCLCPHFHWCWDVSSGAFRTVVATGVSVPWYWMEWLLAVSSGCSFRCHVLKEQGDTFTPWPCGSVSQFEETLEIIWGFLMPFFCPG